MVIHNPKVGGSIPPPATNKINNLGGRHLPLFCYCGDFCDGPRLPLRKRFHCAFQTLVSGVSVTRRCLNTAMPENRHDLSSVSAGVGEPGCGCVSQIVKSEVVETCTYTSSAKPTLEIGSWFLRLVVEKDVLGVTGFAVQPASFPSHDTIHRN